MTDRGSNRGSLLDVGKGALLFAVLGPPIGGIAFTLMLWGLSFAGLDAGQDWALSGTEMLALVFMFTAFSWVVGAVPAAVLGVIAGLVRPRLAQWPARLGLALLGGLLSFGFGQLALGVGGEHLGSEPWAFGVPGAVAGLLLSWWFGHRGARRARAQAGIGESP